MGIRNASKAIIVHENKILVNKNKNSLGEMCYGLPINAIYYDLPGGGQNQYETLEEAVKRECLEETGYTIIIDRLSAVYEEISLNIKFRTEYEQYAYKVHFIFMCYLLNEHKNPLTEKDIDMLESEWVSIDEMRNIPLYPKILNLNLELILSSKNTMYFGSELIN